MSQFADSSSSTEEWDLPEARLALDFEVKREEDMDANLMTFLKGAFPLLTDSQLLTALQCNSFDPDLTMKQLLSAESPCVPSSDDDSNINNCSDNSDANCKQSLEKAILLSELRKGQSVESLMREISDRQQKKSAMQANALFESANRHSRPGRRGTRFLLPKAFLRLPQYRVVLNELGDERIDFTVCYQRNEHCKLGFAVSESMGEVVVTHLHTDESGNPMLAQRSGVQSGDILLGLNGELFSPLAELADVVELLARSGLFVVLHFRRKLNPNRRATVPKEHLHKSISLMIEQNIMNSEQAELVDRMLSSCRRRIEHWNDAHIADRIERLRLDVVDPFIDSQALRADAIHSVSDNRRRRSTGYLRPVQQTVASASHWESLQLTPTAPHVVESSSDRRPISMKSTNGVIGNAVVMLSTSMHVRPALAVRILRAESSPQGDHTQYVVWVSDVKSGVEWIVRRRFREFFDLRETLLRIRPSLKLIDFPPKRIAIEANSLITERLPLLQRFVRAAYAVTTRNEYHPSTIKIQLAMQQFLALDEKLHIIVIQDSETKLVSLLRHAQLYLFGVMNLSIMDKVIHGFVDTFLAHQLDDINRLWTLTECNEVCHELRGFLEHIQSFLYDCFGEDCMEILQRHPTIDQVFASQSAEVLMQLRESTGTASAVSCAGEQKASKDSICDVARMINEDELQVLIRAAIRRQVEIDIYLGCVGRINYVIGEALRFESERFDNKVKRLRSKPQSFFGIPVQHESPSNWNAAVIQFRAVLSHALPSDKIERLLHVSKSLFTLFLLEHPTAEKPLSADDILPIFIYIVVQAQVPNLLAINHELQEIGDTEKQMSEAGYYLATLQASILHITDVNTDKPKFVA